MIEWNDISDSMPDREHIEKRTQFLLKGFFKINESIGDTHYLTARLVDYLPEDHALFFDEPTHYITTHWAEIN